MTTRIIDALVDAGFDIEDIRAISQGYKLNAAIKLVPKANSTVVERAEAAGEPKI